MSEPKHPLMILAAGSDRSGTNDDPAFAARNMRAVNEAALAVFQAGHLPVAGEWFALPLIEKAGFTQMGDTTWDTIFHPVVERIAARFDACLRIGGASAGADAMVALFECGGRPVFRQVEDLPAAAAP